MIKTLTFWLEGVTPEEGKMLRDILRLLDQAHREAVKTWARMAFDGAKCDKDSNAHTRGGCWAGREGERQGGRQRPHARGMLVA